jgi:hypothetical protein
MSRRVYILAHDLARQNAIRAVQEAPAGHWVTLSEPRKSREQESKYHAMIDDIARQYRHAGRQWDAESMKRLLVSAFKHDTKDDPDLAELWKELDEIEIAPGLRGEFVVLGTQTRKFPKKLASAFVEWLYAFGAEHDIRWSERARRAA